MHKILCLSFLFFVKMASAQDDMLQLLGKDTTVSKVVIGTFKGTQLINFQSNETVYGKTLNFYIAHRFGAFGKSTNATSSYHNLYGFSITNDVRIAFEYGITDRFTAGFSRSNFKENWELLGKYRLLRQTNDSKTPFSITIFGNAALSTDQDPHYRLDNPSKEIEASRRLSYVSQIIIARKVSSRISLELIPTYVHHNFVLNPDENNAYAIGIGGRIRWTKTISFVMDYAYNLGSLRKPGNKSGYYNPLGAGLEFETGGHVFTILLTNSYALIENEFITNTVDTWKTGGIRFSFNISRNFSFVKENKKE